MARYLAFSWMSEVWGCASFFERPPNQEIVFVSCVRAGEAKLRVCVREITFLSLGIRFQNFSSPSLLPLLSAAYGVM